MSEILGIYDELPSSPLTFIQPDVFLHVHEMWSNGRHETITGRTYSAVFPLTDLRPFAVYGIRHLMEFLRGWKFSGDDVRFLRSLPSLGSLQEERLSAIAEPCGGGKEAAAVRVRTDRETRGPALTT